MIMVIMMLTIVMMTTMIMDLLLVLLLLLFVVSAFAGFAAGVENCGPHLHFPLLRLRPHHHVHHRARHLHSSHGR